jgi:hypothetical protein
MRKQRRERGALLGVVLVLILVLLAASAFAYFGLRSDTGASGNDRVQRQLFDCAEQALAFGKQYFGDPTIKNSWNQYFNANNVCTFLPCTNHSPPGPFPINGTGAPPNGYPNLLPFTNTITFAVTAANPAGQPVDYTVGLLNGPGDPCGALGQNVGCTQGNNAIVYAQCVDRTTKQTKAVQALIMVPDCNGQDYAGQSGGSFTGQGNRNRGKCR